MISWEGGFSRLKILLYSEIIVATDQLFWHRDLGLLAKGFRDLGHDACLVVHPEHQAASSPSPTTKTPPVIWASFSDVRNPDWWQGHKPDLIILGLWTRPKYDPIRRAALSATPRVIERADSDGLRTASSGGLRAYARRRYDYFRDRTVHWTPAFSVPASALYSLASILATPWIEARLAKTLKLLPGLTVETPRATELWKKLAAKLGADPRRIHCIPHPIQTDIFQPNPSIQKKKQIISVGRWESYQKNFPLLLRTLVSFLNQHPDWSALVVGSGLPERPPHPLITFSKPLPCSQLALRMQESTLFLSASRYESFGLAAAEAAACGCTVLVPPSIFPSQRFQPPGKDESLFVEMMKGRKYSLANPLFASLGELGPQNVAKLFADIDRYKENFEGN